MSCPQRLFFVPEGQHDSSQARSAWNQEKIAPSQRDGASLHRCPGTSCLATISLSLRDKAIPQLTLTLTSGTPLPSNILGRVPVPVSDRSTGRQIDRGVPLIADKAICRSVVNHDASRVQAGVGLKEIGGCLGIDQFRV
jgi:hypothetical protein